MDQKLLKHWIEQLRSGDWRQGRNYLCTRDSKGFKYCCLGVLNEITGNPAKVYDKHLSYLDGRNSYTTRNNAAYLESLGLSISQIGTLARFNDQGRSFKKIADYLETLLDTTGQE